MSVSPVFWLPPRGAVLHHQDRLPRGGTVSTEEIQMIAGEIQPLANGQSAPASDDGFLVLLPRIETYALATFRCLPVADREEAIAEAVAQSRTSGCATAASTRFVSSRA